jgi:hypothetical protein
MIGRIVLNNLPSLISLIVVSHTLYISEIAARTSKNNIKNVIFFYLIGIYESFFTKTIPLLNTFFIS